ncbi:MAG: type III PLP-dependent enzyme [Micavibrio sp.]
MKNTAQNTPNNVLNRRKNAPLSNPYLGTTAELINEARPTYPLYLLRPEKVTARVREFLTGFPGQTMYAVKCNPEKAVLQTMVKAGLRNFDCASIDEIRLIRKVAPKAKIYFMHPVKSRESIREAYHTHGVRAFVLDCVDELYKILQETDLAPDLELFVRLALPKGKASALDLTGKFGASPEAAPDLLQRCRPVSVKLGMSFHVGSQCMQPERYTKAINLAAAAIKASGVKLDVIDVGGGFPSVYPNFTPPPLDMYIEAIRSAMARNRLNGLELLCEPGRALVADSGSLVVRVEQRKGDLLYLNDGTYGSLFDAGGQIQTIFEVKLHRPEGTITGHSAPFRFAGPTCDSLDMMQGPFMLPDDVAEGDWIQIQTAGAYCANMQTRFNGFGQTTLVIMKNNDADSNVIAF